MAGPYPHHRAIAMGMVTVALFVFIGKLGSAAKEMAVAYRYGLGAEVDAYQFSYTLISWPVGIWTSVSTAVLVPLALRPGDAHHGRLATFRAELSGLALAAGVVLACLAWVGIRMLLAAGTSGLPPGTLRLVETALPGMVMLLPLGMLTALHSAWMLAAGRHVNTLFECIPTLCIAGFVLALPGAGIGALVWGTVAGAACHLLALVVPLARRGELAAPRIGMASPQWPFFWQGFGIMVGGQALMSLTVVIDQFHAVGLGTGAVATLGYANRILSLILGLAAIAVSRATLPVFSGAGTEGAPSLRAVVRHWAGLMFAAGILVMLASYFMAPWGVRILFERGQFSVADTAAVTGALRHGLPQLPFYFATMVLVSYALSQRRYALIFWSGVIGCAAKIAGNLALAPRLGVDGIALATAFVYALNGLFFWRTLVSGGPDSRLLPRWFQ